jgi:hypothetical protein
MRLARWRLSHAVTLHTPWLILGALIVLSVAVPFARADRETVTVAGSRSCGIVTKTYSYGSYRFRIYVTKGHVSCSTARRVMRRALVRNRQVSGWYCFNPPPPYDKVCGSPPSGRYNKVVKARGLF